jgi:hypothetical protein
MATAGSDYTSTSGTLSWPNGDTSSKTFSVPILDDSTYEGNETVILTLTNPTGGATLGSPGTEVLTIIDNDQPPGIVYYTMNLNASYSYVDGNNQITSWQGNLNDGYFDLPLGDFDFYFYGTPVTNIRISTNGYITFGTEGTDYSNDSIPNENSPNAIIAPFWDDLNLTGLTGERGVWWDILGSAPNRQLVIEWYQVPSFDYGTETYSFVVILYESNDKIKFQYLDVDSGTINDFGAYATVGIENFDGTEGIQYSFNGSTILSNGLAIEFIPYSGSNIGVFRNGKWFFDINGNGLWEGPATDASFIFGKAGDIPVIGNWNGTPDSVGVFRAGKWYLDWNGNDRWDGPLVDRLYSFGLGGDIPVAGDWNGDGLTEIGVFRNGYWYLDFNGNGIWEGVSVDRRYTFGKSGDIPVVGDWNGDGHPKIGVFRVVNGQGRWYLDANGNGAWDPGVDALYTNFGRTGDIPVVGDWNGDETTKTGVFRVVSGQGRWYLDFNGNGIWETPSVDKYSPSFGSPGDKPVAGRW